MPRFLAITYGTGGPEPTPDAYENLGKLTQEGFEQGWLIDTGAMTAAEAAVKLSHVDGKFSVTDGPFTESKELVAGYAIFDVATYEDAIELSRRFYEIMGGGTGELRQMFSPEELGGGPPQG